MSALDILSAGAAESTVRRLAAADGIEIRGHFGPVGGNRDRLLAGEPCDAIILTGPMIDDLIRSGHVAPGSRADLGRVATAVAVKEGAVRPRISDAAELRTAFLSATSIHYPDPVQATAGAHVAKMLAALGIAEAVASKSNTHAGGAAAMTALARATDAAPIGCTQATEIKATAGIALVGPLPGEFALLTIYAAGLPTRAARPELARRFIARLAGEASRDIRANAGFDV